MSERPKLQLENEGDEAVMLVKYVNEIKTKFGAKLVFVGDVQGREAETPLIPDTTADKQLGRVNLTRQSAVGETLRFSRSPNPSGKPYWNIDLVGMGDAAPKPSGKRISYSEANPSNPSAPSVGGPIKGLDYEEPMGEDESPYDEPGPLPPFTKPPMSAKPAEVAPVATEKAKLVRAYLDLFAWMKSQPEMKDVDADVVQKVSATIWIEWNKRGLVK